MLENGDHANFVFAFFRPHVTSMSVLKYAQPTTDRKSENHYHKPDGFECCHAPIFSPSAFRIGPLSIRFVMDAGSPAEIRLTHYPDPCALVSQSRDVLGFQVLVITL